MQIERIATPVTVAAGKAEATENQTTETNSSTKPAAASTTPLSGGRRTVSFGLLEETNIDIESSVESEAKSAIANLPADFKEHVAQKTAALSKTLTDLFQGFGIKTDSPLILSIDSSGAVKAGGPHKEQIERMFADNPELAKAFKEVATLQSLLAMKVAFDHFADAKKHAGSDAERKQAQTNLMTDLVSIKGLRNTLVLQDGELTSAALAYINGRYGRG